MHRGSAFGVMGLLTVLVAGCAHSPKSSIPGHTPPPDLSYDAAGAYWLAQGVQVGETLDDEVVYGLDGEPIVLSSLWREKPALIVTTSLTCPVARESCLQLAPIIEQHGERVNVALLYTIDAHPAGEECPYTPGEEWLTTANEEQGVYFPQPASLDQRLVLAREMQMLLDLDAPLYVDGMGNEVWLTLGGGPNLAMLVDMNGAVLAKQGWLNAEALTPMLDEAIMHRGAIAPKPQSDEDALRRYLALRNRGDIAGAAMVLAPDARIWFDEKAGEGAPKSLDTGWGAWDMEMHARNTIEELTHEGDAIVTIAHEENDFSRLIGFPGWRSRSTFWFDEQHRIREQLYEPLPQHPAQKDCFAAPLAWLRENRAEELAAVYADDRIEPSAASARAWRTLLIAWRRAANLPIPKGVTERAR